MGVLNDGSLKYLEERDGEGQYFGTCFREFRKSGTPYWIKVTYAGETLSVESAHHGKFFEKCFSRRLSLPTGYYFGVTAQSSNHLPDEHDVYLFETYVVNPPAKPVREIPTEEIASLEKTDWVKDFEALKKHYDDLKERKQEEELGSTDPENYFFILSKIERNQQQLLADSKRLATSGLSVGGTGGGYDYSNRLDELE